MFWLLVQRTFSGLIQRMQDNLRELNEISRESNVLASKNHELNIFKCD